MRLSFFTVLLVFVGIITAQFNTVNAQTYTVTNTNDSGPGSFRQAVIDANNTAGSQTINFEALNSGDVIQIINPIILTAGDGDGTIITGDIGLNGTVDITLQSGPGDGNGIVIEGADNEIRNLHFQNFQNTGNSAILIQNTTAINNLIVSCHFGTNLAANGPSAVGGNERGISIASGASSNKIGDGTIDGRNIFGNNEFGIFISSSDDNLITGNILGMNRQGLAAIPNADNNIDISVSDGTVIGGVNTDDRNIISSSDFAGISLSSATNTIIINNYIGTDINGSNDFGNTREGIILRGSCDGTQIGNGLSSGINVISANKMDGIAVGSSNVSILGNYIGLEANGGTARGNTEHGIQIVAAISGVKVGDGTADGRNIISANGGDGILIQSGPHEVYGNYIGLNAAGTLAQGNTVNGIEITGGASNLIGRAVPGFGNVISANVNGIYIQAPNVSVMGNIIGLNAAGNATRPNLQNGIVMTSGGGDALIGDGTADGANYISGNILTGISMAVDGVNNNTIDGNYIGVETDGVTPAGNGLDGILITFNSNFNTVSNTVIANNNQHGINVDTGGDGNVFTENSIYSNGGKGINILSVPPNPPTVDNVSVTGVISGTADAGATVEIFFDADDEGKSYFATTLANGVGNWSLSGNLQNFPPELFNVTATQLSGGYTSEFSAPAASPFDPFIVVNTNDSGAGSLRWVMENCEAQSGLNTVAFDIPLSDPGHDGSGGTDIWTIQPSTELPQITESVVIDATTQTPGTGNFKIVVDGQGILDKGFDVENGGGGSEFYRLYISGFTTGIDLFYSGGGGCTIGGPGIGNIIVACSGQGINGSLADGHIIQGNYIGTDESGNPGLGNGVGITFPSTSANNLIGGPNAGEGNVISGNSGNGIFINAANNQQIINNYIGTDPSGLNPLPNNNGILLWGSSGSIISGNVISGNNNDGLQLNTASNNTIQGNYIGVGSDGSTEIGNGVGINTVGATNVDNNLIGGTGAGEANIIAYSTGFGINLINANHEFNQFIANSIFCNGDRGIDISPGNQDKMPPQITDYNAGSVSGTGNNGDIIHVYRDNTACVPLQGAEYLGSTTVAGGTWTLVDSSIDPTDLLNATATDALDNSSDFAINYAEILVYQGPDNTGTQLFDGQAAVVDIGSSAETTDLDQEFTIWNKSSATLTIASVTVTGTDFSIIGAPVSVAPNSSENFTLRLSGATIGVFNSTLTINSDDSDEAAFDFDITGEIILNPEIEVFVGPDDTGTALTDGQVAPVDFGSANEGTDIDQVFTVKNTGTSDLVVNDIAVSGTDFQVIAVLPFTLPPGTSNNFTIRLSGGNPGNFNTNVTIDNNDPDESIFEFPVSGDILSNTEIEVFVGPDDTGTAITDGQVSAIDFGSAEQGSDIDQIFTIKNTGTSDLVINDITVSGADFSVIVTVPFTLTPGSFSNFTARLAGDSAATFTTTINIDNSDSDENPFDFPVTGIINLPPEPEISVYLGSDTGGIPITDEQGSAVDFGTGVVGTDLSLTFAIENSGGTNLDISSITFTDTVFSLSGSLPGTIIPGSFQTVTFILSGDLDGVYNGTVDINNNDTDEAVFNVPLTGEITCIDATADAGTGQDICEGEQVSLNGSIGGSAISATWTSDGTGIFDDTSSLTPIYTPGQEDVTTGSVTLTLTTNDPQGTCPPAQSQVAITISQPATIDAGADQAICPQETVSLSGATSGSAGQVQWSTSGDGTFDNTSSLTPVYTPGNADIDSGTITLTLSVLDSCSGNTIDDPMQVAINLGIQSFEQAVSISIGQTANTDVTLDAVYDAADVLTISILEEPVKGESTLLPDGTIDYTPNSGTVGNDSIRFRICNQCNLCDEQIILINIRNEPPVIEVPPDLAATEGGLLEIDLLSGIFDLNDNIDPSSLRITEQPISGALASINSAGILSVDYSGIFFTGNDRIGVEVCDFSGECASTVIEILVEPQAIIVYNAVSPNGDGKHDFLEIENIEFYPNNQVAIFNRWGNVIFTMRGYNNQDKIFTGVSNRDGNKQVPEGTYYYSIDLNNGDSAYTGYLVIKRNTN